MKNTMDEPKRAKYELELKKRVGLARLVTPLTPARAELALFIRARLVLQPYSGLPTMSFKLNTTLKFHAPSIP